MEIARKLWKIQVSQKPLNTCPRLSVVARSRDKVAYEARWRSRGSELSGSNIFVAFN